MKTFHLSFFMHNKMLGLAYKRRSTLFSSNSFIFEIISASSMLSFPALLAKNIFSLLVKFFSFFPYVVILVFLCSPYLVCTWKRMVCRSLGANPDDLKDPVKISIPRYVLCGQGKDEHYEFEIKVSAFQLLLLNVWVLCTLVACICTMVTS